MAQAYAFWLASHPFDVGTTTRQALNAATQAQNAGTSASLAARTAANPHSQANGALMRISPLGIFGAFCTVDNVFSSAVEDAKLTHPNEVCQHSSALFACTIAHAIASGEARDSIYRFAVELAAHRKLNDSVISAIRAAESAPPASFTSQQGWVLIALQNAFYQLLHAPTLEAGVIDTVMHGGDTDTNAAIAGALLGAVHGRDTIPQQWRRSILTCRPMHGLIDSAIVHPRPSCFWPVDAMELAERLLWVGSQK